MSTSNPHPRIVRFRQERPGAPARQEGQAGRGDRSHARGRETDRLVERELRTAVGDEAAEQRLRDAPGEGATAAAVAAEAAARRKGVGAWLSANGVLLGVSFAVFAVVGVMISLATGSWWAFAAAIVAHAIGTLLVATLAISKTTETEHVSPQLAARLHEEGVADPDRAFSELAAGGAGADDVVLAGSNQRTADSEGDLERAAREQRTAFTPGSRPSEPSGARFIAVVIAVGAVVVAIGAAGLLIAFL